MALINGISITAMRLRVHSASSNVSVNLIALTLMNHLIQRDRADRVALRVAAAVALYVMVARRR
ncbi:MAG: hypothetical protein QM813_15210 [Verrucomicrobiota bacterium]